MMTTGTSEAYGIHFRTVTAFKYLDSILISLENNCPEVLAKLRKARIQWARISQIIVKEVT